MVLDQWANANSGLKSFKYKTNTILSNPILKVLEKKFPTIKWEKEHPTGAKIGTSNYRDKIDIFGEIDENTIIIIEIDTYRADQVSKKYASRMAIYKDKNVIYITYCYPNEHKSFESEKKETEKYFKYLEMLTEALDQSTTYDKCYRVVAMP